LKVADADVRRGSILVSQGIVWVQANGFNELA
jgi:hypothetical protein